MNPKLSIIIPCYNYAKFLPECVDSIRSQSYTDYEIIVVSDGSPDNTKDVCEMLGVKCLEKPNGGLSSARNYGIEHAVGKYIMCLDADDLLPPESLANHMKNAGKKIISQCGLREFGESHRIYKPVGATLNSMMVGNTVFCNAVFPKKEWEEVGGYDESEVMRLGYEDWEFWIRLVGNGCRVIVSDAIGLLYRFHQTSMTRTTTHKNHKQLVEYIINKNKHLLNENK